MIRIIYIALIGLSPLTLFCQQLPWHGKERTIHYRPEGKDFISNNGTLRFNRALYGGNTAFRVEAGDLPEWALYLPGMGGNCKLGIIAGNNSKWLTEARSIKAIYRPGSMLYEIRDPLLGAGMLQVSVLATYNHEAMLLQVIPKGITTPVQLLGAFGGVTGKKFSRDGDIGADPESSFYLQPPYCINNVYELNANTFILHYGEAGAKKLEGIFPAGTQLHTASPGKQQSPLLLDQSAAGDTSLVCGKVLLKKTDTTYFFIRQPGAESPSITYNDLPALFRSTEASRQQLAARVQVNTPDPYINTLGGALATAADAIWDDPTYMHGAIAWRMRLPAWRGAYVADALGWHDRAHTHFSSYAQSQMTAPLTGPLAPDTALHFARQQEKIGNTLFSSGYICRNPNGDIRPHHYDMNLVFVDQLLTHFLYTGDTAFIVQMWPVIERHLAWEKRNFDADNDGLYDAYCCIWASDALQYSGGGVTHSSAYNYRANKMAATLAAMAGKDGTLYQKKLTRLNKPFIVPFGCQVMAGMQNTKTCWENNWYTPLPACGPSTMRWMPNCPMPSKPGNPCIILIPGFLISLYRQKVLQATITYCLPPIGSPIPGLLTMWPWPRTCTPPSLIGKATAQRMLINYGKAPCSKACTWAPVLAIFSNYLL
ncbi:DUF4450 domain-containing protein [Paraflavitalea speifideaquila]|uniref:DUF4450 domain-containing protein n=1 Tax=Paraflavitalea speifideaquila TaxID=3076558 RepID=UPI0028E61C97|nr:DUF4450 domain-containing protein [Paraflavitalea speifideiaquila]